MSGVMLNGNRAVKINAAQIAATERARCFKVDLDKYWVSKKLHEFKILNENTMEGELTIVEWLYNKLFPNG